MLLLLLPPDRGGAGQGGGEEGGDDEAPPPPQHLLKHSGSHLYSNFSFDKVDLDDSEKDLKTRESNGV